VKIAREADVTSQSPAARHSDDNFPSAQPRSFSTPAHSTAYILHADLYRATKGAGTGGLGAMTRLTLRVVPVREGGVTWFHGGAVWNEQSLEAQALAFVDALFAVLNPILQSQTAQYGVPDLQLGSQLTDLPNFNYVQAFWSSPTLNFVPFLIGVKQKYDPQDLLRFAQSVPVSI
jgi:hypothetical protein